jgi:hypothetical protein
VSGERRGSGRGGGHRRCVGTISFVLRV